MKHIGEKCRRGTSFACCVIYLPGKGSAQSWAINGSFSNQELDHLGNFPSSNIDILIFLIIIFQSILDIVLLPLSSSRFSQSWAAIFVKQNSLKTHYCTPNPLSNWLRRKKKPPNPVPGLFRWCRKPKEIQLARPRLKSPLCVTFSERAHFNMKNGLGIMINGGFWHAHSPPIIVGVRAEIADCPLLRWSPL